MYAKEKSCKNCKEFTSKLLERITRLSVTLATELRRLSAMYCINSCFRRRGSPMKRLQFIIIGVVETITRVVVKVSAVDYIKN